MSHGRRMLEAQAQKERISTTRDDGRVDDGHLRNIGRMLNDDGTPVRSVRPSGNGRRSGETEEKEGQGEGERCLRDPLFSSPPPRPSVQLSHNDGGKRREKRRRSPLRSFSTPQINLGQTPKIDDSKTRAEGGSRGRPQEQKEQQRVAVRHIDVDADSNSDDEEEVSVTLTKGGVKEKEARMAGYDWHEHRQDIDMSSNMLPQKDEGQRSRQDAPRYPADRVYLQGTNSATPSRQKSPLFSFDNEEESHRVSAPPPSPLHMTDSALSRRSSASSTPIPRDEQRRRTTSRSPPLVTLTKASLAGHCAGSVQKKPVTAALRPPSTAHSNKNNNTRSSNMDAATASLSFQGQRPPPFLPPGLSASSSSRPVSVTTTAAAAAVPPQTPTPPALLMSPASPPLRAGVSPRMLPRHPTRLDPSASFSASRAASASNTMLPSPPLSQVQHQPQNPQPLQLDELQDHLARARSPSSAAAPRDLTNEDEKRSEAKTDHADISPELAQKRTAGETMPMPAMGKVDEWGSMPVPLLPSTQPSGRPVPTLSPTAEVDNTTPYTLPPALSADGVAPAPLSSQPFPPPPAPPNSFATAATIIPYPAGASVLTHPLDAKHYPYLRDFSGFHNTGNDCYGCSALTMLLRSTVFRRALLSSPLVTAVRRYESLVTQRPVRQVQWTSGYVETPTPQRTKKLKKRTRAGQDQGRVSEVCGLPTASTAPPTFEVPTAENDVRLNEGSVHTFSASLGLFPTPAVQQTLDLIDTLTPSELEDVLQADLETEHIPITLHSALAALARATRWREHMTRLINSPSLCPSERQRFLAEKIFHDNDRLFDGQVYTYGIRLNSVASFFHGEFFLGEQEDAHELFVALLAKLETEAVDFQKRCAEVLEVRQRRRGRGRQAAPYANEEKAETKDEEETTADDTPPLRISTAMSDAWINALVQTRLLNIIRCRSPGCQHEIVTDEICVNLSLYIPEEEEENREDIAGYQNEANVGRQARNPSSVPIQENQQPTSLSEDQRDDYFYFPCVESSTTSSPPAPPTTSLVSAISPHCSVAALLYRSIAFEPLSDYRCDACGSKSSQYQGGCFYTRPPPVLVLQLKRFSTDFLNGTLRIQKNSCPVAVDDALVIFALPSTEELHQRDGQPPPRLLTPSEIEGTDAEGSHRKQAEETKCPTPVATAAAAAAQERRFFYNAAEKCFTSTAAPDEGPGSISSREMSEASSAEWVTAIRSVYRLQSCVLHLGPSLYFGHYVSDFAVDGEEEGGEEEERDSDYKRRIRAERDCEDAYDEEYENVKLCDPKCTSHAAMVNATRDISSGSAPTCRCRRRWRRANDERVEVLGEDAVRPRRTGSSDMYLLLYEKWGEEWVRCPVDAVLPRPVYPTEGKHDAGGQVS